MPKFGKAQPNPPERGKIPPQLAQFVGKKKKGGAAPAKKGGPPLPPDAPTEDGPVSKGPKKGKGAVPPQLAGKQIKKGGKGKSSPGSPLAGPPGAKQKVAKKTSKGK